MKCDICDSLDTTKYFELRNSPILQNVLYDSREAARNTPVLDAAFWLCNNCFFLFNPGFHGASYNKTYNNDQSFSGVYREHLCDVATLLKRYIKTDSRIVEIGCGNGLVLKMLHEEGYLGVEGYDPAHSNKYSFVRTEYWKPTEKKYDLLIFRHALESLDNYRELLQAGLESLDDDGLLYLELTSATYIVENASTVSIYHEYPQYFSEIAINLLLNKLGFTIFCLQPFFKGDIFGVFAKRKRVRESHAPRLEKLKSFNNVCIWGIGGRAIHFLTNYNISTEVIKFGVDIDPKKHGQFIPNTCQKILSPADCLDAKPDAVVLLNESYASEVAGFFNYPIKIFVERDFYDE